MAYDSRVYRILIASPSDVEEEREIAVKVIQEWNDLYSYSRKVALLPLRWETHTAPEYGTRPQEVINRAIVDQCDILVGVFWTRIGSPTGVADSGTLEEIERVGNAGKPIMLYFSRVEIDPERIELNQIDRLKRFRDKTYPQGLVETYRKVIEFRDKFAKQLELKVRDLQLSDLSGGVPVSLEFFSPDESESESSQAERLIDHAYVEDFSRVPAAHRKTVEDFATKAVQARTYVPIPLVIRNSSASGIRNLYTELDFFDESGEIEMKEVPFSTLGSSLWTYTYTTALLSNFYNDESEQSAASQNVQPDLQRFDAGKLQKTSLGWRLSFEWEALQPQRIRLVKPVVYAYSPQSTQLAVRARIFADSFPEPIELAAQMKIEVQRRLVDLDDLLPNWKALIDKSKSNKGRINLS